MKENPKGAGNTLEWFPWDCPKCGKLWWYKLDEQAPDTACCFSAEEHDLVDVWHQSRLDRWWRLLKHAGIRSGRRSVIKQLMTLGTEAKSNPLYLRIFQLINKMLPERLRVEPDVDTDGEPFPTLPLWTVQPQAVADIVLGTKLTFRIDADTASPVIRIESLDAMLGGRTREITFNPDGTLQSAKTVT
jgi:hypothetical protein